ncbi:hypothetical protein G9A89_023013 [Geosiphon pyriformis]|nr:hypothetical protein G9A89_023013 [Geosiphon pyriformis]
MSLNIEISTSENTNKSEYDDIKIIEKVLEIFIGGNAKWKYDDEIKTNILQWLSRNRILPKYVYEIVSSHQDNPRYWTLLAFLNLCEVGISGDHSYEAYKWYKRAAENNDPLGQQELGCFLQRGIGIVEDLAEARYWFRQAADADMAIAQFRLGKMYLVCPVGPESKEEGFKLIKKSAQAGFSDAIEMVLWCYENGIGVKKNVLEAFHWLKNNSQMVGSPLGSQALAQYHLSGRGTLVDKHQGLKVSRLALRNGVNFDPYSIQEIFNS